MTKYLIILNQLASEIALVFWKVKMKETKNLSNCWTKYTQVITLWCIDWLEHPVFCLYWTFKNNSILTEIWFIQASTIGPKIRGNSSNSTNFLHCDNVTLHSKVKWFFLSHYVHNFIHRIHTFNLLLTHFIHS